MVRELKEIELKALRVIRNALVHDGYSPSVREVAEALGYRSPRSAMLVLNRLIEAEWIERRPDGALRILKDRPERESHARTVDVPLVGNVACGNPLLAEENIEAHIPVSRTLAKPGGKYFLLRARGDSMNAAGINDGDLLLIRQQSTAENGQAVVALIDEGATVKEFHREKDVILLKPRSKNKAHQPFILSENFVIQGVVMTTIPNVRN